MRKIEADRPERRQKHSIILFANAAAGADTATKDAFADEGKAAILRDIPAGRHGRQRCCELQQRLGLFSADVGGLGERRCRIGLAMRDID
jgi:hypothetical protein